LGKCLDLEEAHPEEKRGKRKRQQIKKLRHKPGNVRGRGQKNKKSSRSPSRNQFHNNLQEVTLQKRGNKKGGTPRKINRERRPPKSGPTRQRTVLANQPRKSAGIIL